MERRNLKIILLKEVLENKQALFGSFSPSFTKTDKNNAWKRIHQKAQALGLVPNSKDYTYTRDVLWQNMKKASLKKRDNSRRTGTGGGPSSKINQVDEFVFQIIGRDTPALDGLVEPESIPTPSTSQSALNDTAPPTPDSAVETVQPSPMAVPVNKSLPQKKNILLLKEQKYKLINEYLALKIKKLQSQQNSIEEPEIITVNNPEMVEEYLLSSSDSDEIE